LPHRRPRKRGSFGSHFDELVVQFREPAPAVESKRAPQRSKRLQEKIDVHSLLFRRAWQLDDEG
jgi:hypothetical protein